MADTALTSEIHFPGRRIGVVARAESRSRGFIFLRDEAGVEYFAHRTGFLDQQALFDTIERGTAVTFKVTQKPKGLQAHAVELAGEAEAAGTREWAERMGNK